MSDDAFPTITEFGACFLTYLLFVYSILGVGYLIFARLAVVQFLTAAAILVTSVLIYYALWIIDFCLVRYHKKNEAEGNERIRNRLLISIGMITMCTVPIRIAVLYVKEPNEIFFYMLFTTHIFIAQIGNFCLRPIFEMCKVNPQPRTKTSWLILITSFVIDLILMRSLLDYSDEVVELTEEEKRKQMNILLMRTAPQVLISILSAISSFELHKVWNGEFELLAGAEHIFALEHGEKVPSNREKLFQDIDRNLENVRERVERFANRYMELDESFRCTGLNCPFAAELFAPTIRTNAKIDCKVCFTEYSETRIPRMLKECGHTICEECAAKLLDKNRGKIIFCPFCQTGTAVNGPASRLSKNYTVMDILDSIKKEA